MGSPARPPLLSWVSEPQTREDFPCGTRFDLQHCGKTVRQHLAVDATFFFRPKFTSVLPSSKFKIFWRCCTEQFSRPKSPVFTIAGIRQPSKPWVETMVTPFDLFFELPRRSLSVAYDV